MEKKFNQGLKDTAPSNLRRFGLSFSLGMAVLLAIAFWKGYPYPVKALIASLCCYHFAFALLNDKMVYPSYLAISFIGKLLGNTVTTIIFSLFYFFVFTPYAIIIRWCRKDVMRQDLRQPEWRSVPEKANDPKRVEKSY